MKRAAIILFLMGGLCACTRERPAPIPRPRAYPRAVLYPAVYHEVAFGATALLVNDSARVSRPRPDWLNIAYGAYNLTLNLTLTRGGDIHSALDNRARRMALNLAGATGELEQFRSRSGLYVTMLTAPEALRTPLQFLATDSAGMMLSGVAVGDFEPTVSADSIAPVVGAVKADLTYMLQNL